MRWAVLALILLMSHVAVADPLTTTEEMARNCKRIDATGRGAGSAEGAECAGFLNGVNQAMIFWMLRNPASALFCVPESRVPSLELSLRAFLKYASENPESRDNPAALSYARSMADLFPCPPKK